MPRLGLRLRSEMLLDYCTRLCQAVSLQTNDSLKCGPLCSELGTHTPAVGKRPGGLDGPAWSRSRHGLGQWM